MRPTRDENLMEIAHVVAKRSTCSRAQVGCIAAQDGRILVSGYNGAPSGMPHCHHTEVNLVNEGIVEPSPISVGCKQAVHAEANAVAFAARHGVALKNAELYCTHTPCLPCAQLIVNCGLVRVHCQQPYRDSAGLTLLTKAGLDVVMVNA